MDDELLNILETTFGPSAVTRADYARHGFHLLVDIQAGTLPDLAEIMLRAGRYLEYVTAVDQGGQFELIHVFGSYERLERVRVRTALGPEESAPSLAAIYPAANWHEREVHDMFGLLFAGHPDLKPLLLPEDAAFHPLRRDFASGESDFHDDFDLGDD